MNTTGVYLSDCFQLCLHLYDYIILTSYASSHRPLPPELSKYAREDTHYLLYIYDRMRNELLRRGNKQNNLLRSVLDRSRDICLKTYKKPVFSEDGYLYLYNKHKRTFNSQQVEQ